MLITKNMNTKILSNSTTKAKTTAYVIYHSETNSCLRDLVDTKAYFEFYDPRGEYRLYDSPQETREHIKQIEEGNFVMRVRNKNIDEPKLEVRKIVLSATIKKKNLRNKIL